MIYGFTVRNWKNVLPTEDSFGLIAEKNLIAVADGITRDCSNGKPAIKTINGVCNVLLHYPRPSPARLAADLFCQESLTFLAPLNELDENSLGKAMCRANDRIRGQNVNMGITAHNVDYLGKDYAACVGSVVAIDVKQEVLNYGFVADCGVAVFDERGNLRFRTPNEGPNSKGSISKDIGKLNLGWEHPEFRVRVRRDYRNKPANPLAYGAFTGEANAMLYTRTGSLLVFQNDAVIAYTDGVENTIFGEDGDVREDFASLLMRGNIQGLERLCKREVESEGTLVISKKDLSFG